MQMETILVDASCQLFLFSVGANSGGLSLSPEQSVIGPRIPLGTPPSQRFPELEAHDPDLESDIRLDHDSPTDAASVGQIAK